MFIEGKGEVRGFVFEQIAKSNFGYVYKVDTSERVHYEVFLLRTTPVCIDFETRTYSETELAVRYPRSNDFGKWAWTYTDKDSAMSFFKGLNKGLRV